MAVITASSSSDNLKGAAFMMLSMAGFVTNDAVLKFLYGDIDLFHAVFIRGLFATALIFLFAAWRGALRFTFDKRDAPVLGIRVTAEICATVSFLTALFNMPLANAQAILQAMPLTVTLAAALFMGERVGWRRYSAIAVGFVGVMIIVRPGTEGFNAFSLYALATVLFATLRDLQTRRLSKGIPSLFVTLCTSVAITTASGIACLFTPWPELTGTTVAGLALASVFLFAGYFFGVTAMRVGEIGFVSPFRYTILVWALVLGIVVFDEYPDSWMIAGSLIVTLTGIYTLYRERKLAMVSRSHPSATAR